MKNTGKVSNKKHLAFSILILVAYFGITIILHVENSILWIEALLWLFATIPALYFWHSLGSFMIERMSEEDKNDKSSKL